MEQLNGLTYESVTYMSLHELENALNSSINYNYFKLTPEIDGANINVSLGILKPLTPVDVVDHLSVFCNTFEQEEALMISLASKIYTFDKSNEMFYDNLYLPMDICYNILSKHYQTLYSKDIVVTRVLYDNYQVGVSFVLNNK